MAKFFILLLLPTFVLGQKNYSDLVDKYMQAQAKINDFSGTVLIMKSDQSLLKKAYGLANREHKIPNTVDTKFRIYSITKEFTATCILKLAEDGHLNLQDKLSKYFSDFPNGNDITIHMLLTHTSGLPAEFKDVSDGLENFLNYVKQDISRDSILALAKKLPLLFPPGTDWSYSNVGYVLLTYIIEKVSGSSYSDYVTKNIFIPLKMSNSGVYVTNRTYSKMAISYYNSNKKMVKSDEVNMDFDAGAGAIYATIEDLYKWNCSLYNNSILQDSSKKKMFTAYRNDYGYGISIDTLFNHFVLSHNGGFLGFQSSLLSFTKDSICIIVFSNNESHAGRIAYSLSGILFDIPVALPYKHIATPTNPKLYDKYVGKYGGIEISKINGQLIYKNNETELLAESNNRFFLADTSDWIIEFNLNSNGDVVSLTSSIGGISDTVQKDK